MNVPNNFKQGVTPEMQPGSRIVTDSTTSHDVSALHSKLKAEIVSLAKKKVKGFVGLTADANLRSCYTLNKYVKIMREPRLYPEEIQSRPLSIMQIENEN